MHRIVVTGLGAITPIGLSAETYWANLRAGVSGVERISSFETENYQVRIAAEARDFDPLNYMDYKTARRMDRFAQFAVAAAGQAIADAGLDMKSEDPDRVGVMLNTGGGGIRTMVRESLNYHINGPSKVSPFSVLMIISNMAACQISIMHGIQGPVMSSVAACAAGSQALIDARRMLLLGEVDAMVVGGTEALMGLAIIGFGNLGALSRRNDEPARASRPFDKDRDGCVMGEGCGVLVLETEEHARRRGAHVYCEMTGGALTADAFHITVPAPGGEGAARAMRLAMKNAKLAPSEIDYICAHGTATPLNDVAETEAIKAAMGEAAYRVPISSTKSMVGHLFGAAGAVACITSALAIRDNVVPPTINLDTPDPACDLDYVPHTAREVRVDHAMVNAFGFGGQNAVVVLSRYDEP